MKHPSLRIMLGILACNGAYSGACHASAALLEVLDNDGNGYLTLEETQNNPRVHFRFSQADRNKNDRLEAEEMELLNMPPSFADFDVNEDLVINPEEASALHALQSRFGQLDRNQDMRIDPAEFAGFEPDPGSG